MNQTLKKIVDRLKTLDTPSLMQLAIDTDISFSTLYRLRKGVLTDPRLSVYDTLKKKFRIA